MAELLFVLTGILTLVISGMLAYNFLRHYQNEKIKKVSNWFSLLFFVYILLSYLYFSWYFEDTAYSLIDFQIIYSVLMIITVVLFLQIAFLLSGNKKILFFGVMILLISLISLFVASNPYPIILSVCYFILILISFHFFLRREECRGFGYALATYSSISLLFEIFDIAGLFSKFYISFTFILFLSVVISFIRKVENFPRNIVKLSYKKESKVLNFIRYFIFILILFNLILLSSLVIHEAGHIATARLLECSYSTFIFQENGNNLETEVLCRDAQTGLYVAIGGILSVMMLAIMLFIIGGLLSRSISLIMFGTGIILSNKDLVMMDVSMNLILSANFAALILIIWGVAKLSRFRFEEVF